MRIILPSVEVIGCNGQPLDGERLLRHIELCGRTAYQSFDRIHQTSHYDLVKLLIKRGHESVLEHGVITVRLVTNRGVLAELTRHRIASYTVESTRFCNYSKEKFGREITVILPEEYEIFWDFDKKDIKANWEGIPVVEKERFITWYEACKKAEQSYLRLIELGCRPEQARAVLPMSLKTEIKMTANLREWRHILKLRIAPNVHPEMRRIMRILLKEFQAKIPIIFDDIKGE